MIKASSTPDGSLWKIRDTELYVRCFGREDAPVLLIVHGGPGANHKKLLPLSAFSSKFRVVFYDQRGTGDSARLPISSSDDPNLARLTLEENVRDIEAIREYLGANNISLLGHSWGGALVTFYAAEYPDRVNKLVVSSGGPEDMQLWEEKERNHSQKRTHEENLSLKKKVKELESGIKSGAPQDQLDRLFGEAICISYPSLYFKRPVQVPEIGRTGFWANAVIGQYCETFDRAKFAEQLKGITCPTLLFLGKHEPSPEERLLYLKRHIPNAQMVTFENSGHNAMEEESELFFSKLSAFLSS
ncbi:MAG TPA: alpha/beta fold hydrolase [Bdellovibrionota bacterium]|nr:alpha/beta fold hydrolase [Bdellovibrionota bacterium]